VSFPSLSGNLPLLVGREREVALLRQHLAAAMQGRGSMMLIGGEAGVGKSALAAALCREAAEQSILVFVGHCYDLNETPPYGLWVELFGRYRRADGMPPLPRAFARRGTIGQVASQAALFQEVADFLVAVATTRPLLLLLEDLHWADPGSLDLLRFVARSLGDQRLLILTTFRSEEVARQHPLSTLVPLLVREAHADRLALRPLDEAATRAFLDARHALPSPDAEQLVTYLRGRGEGNALFLTEMLRVLEETGVLRHEGEGWVLGPLDDVAVPPLLRQIIDARVARLGDETQRLLGMVAVGGQVVRYDLWAAVAGVDEGALLDAVAEAAAAQIMVEHRDGSGAAFTHALVREAVYEGTRPSQRRRWHRAAGETLAAQPHADADAVAFHFQRAGDARAVEWLIVAAERAQRAWALLGAAERLAAAASLCAASGDTMRQGWLLVRLAPLYRYSAGAGDGRTRMAALEDALRLAGSDDPALVVCARYLRGNLLCNRGEFRRGLAEMAGASAMLDALPQAERARVQASGVVAEHLDDAGRFHAPMIWLAFLGRYREAQAMAEGAVAASSSRGPGSAFARHDATAYRTLAICHAAFGRPAEARAAYAQCRITLHALGMHTQIGITAVDELERVVLPYYTEHVAERHRLAVEGEEAWRRSGGALRPGALASGAPPEVAHVPVQALEGDWTAVRTMTQERRGLEGGTASGPIAARAIGMVARLQGETTLAWDLVRAALPAGPDSEPGEARYFDRMAMQRLAIEMSLYAEDFPAAQAWLEAYDRWLTWSGSVHGLSEGEALWARYYRAAGDRERALMHAERALGHATLPRQPLALLAAHRLLGELAADTNCFTEARRHLDLALTIAEACAAPYERAQVLLALAALQAAQGHVDEAATALNDCRSVFTALGAQPALARVEALATRFSTTPGAAPRYPAALSPREVEVLRLLAAGRTNRDIAAALRLSERTVHVHITHIFTKTQSENRAAATAFAYRHGLA
jgi:DNA-binding CsgD family transcriptional regulator